MWIVCRDPAEEKIINYPTFPDDPVRFIEIKLPNTLPPPTVYSRHCGVGHTWFWVEKVSDCPECERKLGFKVIENGE